MKRLLLLLIRFYRAAISPLFLPHCRYYPTCSAYALEAVTRYGAWRGGWMALRRLIILLRGSVYLFCSIFVKKRSPAVTSCPKSSDITPKVSFFRADAFS